MPHNLANEKSTLVQAMARRHQATSHYLGRCWPNSMSPYGVNRPQWLTHQFSSFQIFPFFFNDQNTGNLRYHVRIWHTSDINVVLRNQVLKQNHLSVISLMDKLTVWRCCNPQSPAILIEAEWRIYASVILSWCWWNFLTSANQIAQIGSCDRSRMKELIPSLRSWLWYHRLPNVTKTEAQPRLWCHLGVCGVTAMTENEVSISILSWYHKINFELGVVVKPNCLSAVQV